VTAVVLVVIGPPVAVVGPGGTRFVIEGWPPVAVVGPGLPTPPVAVVGPGMMTIAALSDILFKVLKTCLHNFITKEGTTMTF
jgi:hypothetical protein